MFQSSPLYQSWIRADASQRGRVSNEHFQLISNKRSSPPPSEKTNVWRCTDDFAELYFIISKWTNMRGHAIFFRWTCHHQWNSTASMLAWRVKHTHTDTIEKTNLPSDPVCSVSPFLKWRFLVTQIKTDTPPTSLYLPFCSTSFETEYRTSIISLQYTCLYYEKVLQNDSLLNTSLPFLNWSKDASYQYFYLINNS